MTIPWEYPSTFEKVEWFFGNDVSGPLMLTYNVHLNDFIANTSFQVTYINNSDSIGVVVQDVDATVAGFTVRVTVREFVTEDANVPVTVIAGRRLSINMNLVYYICTGILI